MMAVIFFFCLRPPTLDSSERRARKQAACWQLGSYIWVPPPENPQGLAQLYVRRLFICKEKSAGFVDFPRDCGKFLFRNQPVCSYPRPAPLLLPLSPTAPLLLSWLLLRALCAPGSVPS